MAYFSQLPNIYVGEGITDDESFKYRLVKNLFRRTITRVDMDKYITLLEPYHVGDHETPPLIAHTMYGDINLDWIILLTNNIIYILVVAIKKTREGCKNVMYFLGWV